MPKATQIAATITKARKESSRLSYPQKVTAHYSKVINYLEAMRFHYGDDVLFLYGYEAGCLGFTLYHELTAHNVKCVILAPTSMPVPCGKRESKQISATQP